MKRSHELRGRKGGWSAERRARFLDLLASGRSASVDAGAAADLSVPGPFDAGGAGDDGAHENGAGENGVGGAIGPPSVKHAARAVGLSAASAYAARKRLPVFAQEWDIAVAEGWRKFRQAQRHGALAPGRARRDPRSRAPSGSDTHEDWAADAPYGGWTAAAQRHFLRELMRHGKSGRACAAVGLSPRSLSALCRRAPGFAKSVKAAYDHHVQRKTVGRRQRRTWMYDYVFYVPWQERGAPGPSSVRPGSGRVRGPEQ